MIIGHQKQRKALKHFLEKENTPHAFIFHGPEKVGKKSIAFDFISSVNGIEEYTQNHPDLFTVFPEKGEIYIHQIEEMVQRASLKSSFLRFKGVVIDEAHLMNTEAQNSLLKTLEEPVGDTIIILVTEHPFMLLPTISSRAFKMGFGFVDTPEISKFLLKRGCSESEEIATLSCGRPGLAFEYFSDKEKRNTEKERRKEFADIVKGSVSFRLLKVKEIAKREDLVETMKCWLDYLRDDLLERVKKRESVKNMVGVIEDLEDAIILNRKTNINIQLILEKIMIKL